MFLRDLQSGFFVRFLARENGIGSEVTVDTCDPLQRLITARIGRYLRV